MTFFGLMVLAAVGFGVLDALRRIAAALEQIAARKP